jgi:hypothetical protein
MDKISIEPRNVKTLIVCGSRHYNEDWCVKQIERIVNENGFTNIKFVIEGEANGPDKAARKWATTNNKVTTKFIAEWDRYGKGAGHIRNKEMCSSAILQRNYTDVPEDVCIAIWDGKSRGTGDMIKLCKAYGIPTLVFTPMTKEELDELWNLVL